MYKVNAWDSLPKTKVMSFAEEYKSFLNECKTERETVSFIEKAAKKKGFGKGKKLIFKHHNKVIALVTKGKKKGIKVVAAHLDSNRLDLKQNPVIEDNDARVSMLKTHYYGGIKKFHWVNIPLAMHGVVFLKNGKKLDIKIGEKESEPVFVVPDIAIHIGKKQMEKKMDEGVTGESLTVLAGSIPVNEPKEKEKYKKALLSHLKKEFNIEEEDFVSAELELVPAMKARDVGFDNSMVGAYAQDDRSCSFAALNAALETKSDYTTITLFYDKEEIGSYGATSASSLFLENLVESIGLTKKDLMNAKCLSADVNTAINPMYKDLHDLNNSASLGQGICVSKFTGARGKSGTSDASAEFVSEIRGLFNKKKVPWQTGELGKVDEGGGGTIAIFFAKYGMHVIDAGPALLSMHSTFEVGSKADLYSAYLAYKCFLD